MSRPCGDFLWLSRRSSVAETILGLVYRFVFEGRCPTITEAIGATLQFFGVGSGLAVFSRPPFAHVRAATCHVLEGRTNQLHRPHVTLMACKE
jgi:hypothetical protein